jgi:F420-0:gamma-glutamyl ligase
MPSTTEIVEQVEELEAKALNFLTDTQAAVVDYVAKAADTLAERLPEERPAALVDGFGILTGQVDFAKKVLDANSTFAKALLDAAVKPVRPVRKAKSSTVKAA